MRIRSVVLALLVVFVGTLAAQAQGRNRPVWVRLGERVVTDRADHDTILVTAAKGTFRAIRIDVAGHAVDFHRVVIHFRAGADQNVQLRDTIRAGGSSRVIDVEGGDRVIRSIDFWYDAKTIGRGGKATVTVMGRE